MKKIIFKMIENRNQQNIFKRIVTQLFLQPTVVPSFVELLVTFFEFLIFTLFVSSNSVSNSLIVPDQIQRNIIILLIGLTLMKILVRTSCIKAIYVLLIVWNIQLPLSAISIFIWILMFVHILIDVITKAQFSFSTRNLHAQTFTLFIGIHYAVFTAVTVVRYLNFTATFILPVCEVVLFAVLIAIKYKSITKFQAFQNIQIRFYYLTIFYAIAELLAPFTTSHMLAKHVFAIILSQMLFQVVDWKSYRQFSVEQYISRKMQLEAGFIVFSNLYSKDSLSDGMLKAIKTLANQDTNCLIEDNKTFKQSASIVKLREKGGMELSMIDFKQVTFKICDYLKNQTSLLSKLLIIELHIYEIGNHVKSRHLLTELEAKIPWYNIIGKVLLYKIEKRLIEEMTIEHQRCVSPNFYEFIQNDQFRSLLLKSTLDFICLWQYTKVKEGIYKKINDLAEKVVESKQKIREKYSQLTVKCIQTNLLFGRYLSEVERDVQKANQIMQLLYFNQQFQECFDTSKKIYIKILIDKDGPLKISNIGGNVNKLLGYERRLLIGVSITNLIPQFFKQSHELIVKNMIENQPKRLFLFTKPTIIKNAQGAYSTLLFSVRLSYNQKNEMFLQGFIKLNSDPKHNWSNYLFVRQEDKQILEYSQMINERVTNSQSKRFVVDEVFDKVEHDFCSKVQTMTTQFNTFLYQPVLNFETLEGKVTMFVEIDPFSTFVVQQQNEVEGQQKRQIIIPKMIVFPKYRVFNNIKNYLRKKVSTNEVLESLNKKLILLLVLTLLGMIGIYVIEGVWIMGLNNSYNTKIKAMSTTDSLVKHYMGLTKISVDMSYQIMTKTMNYSSSGFKQTLRQNILTVQSTNKQFKPYSMTQYEYPSKSTRSQHITCYQLICQMLASASISSTLSSSIRIVSSMMQSFSNIFPTTLIDSYPQYINGVHQQLNNNNKSQQMMQIILLVFLVLLGVGIYICTYKLENFIRLSQFHALKFIGEIPYQGQMLDKCKEFLHTLTEEKLEYLTNQKSISFGVGKNENDLLSEVFKVSQMTGRQNTGRDLLGSSTSRDDFKLGSKSQQVNVVQQYPIKLKPANKWFLIVPLVLIVGMFSIQLVNYIVNSRSKEIDEAASSTNLVTWMNKPLYFSRIVSAYMIESRGANITSHNQIFGKAFSLFQNQYTTISSFQQIAYPQFAQFSEKLRQVRFQYLCTYASCPADQADYINIIFTTTMQKLATYMQTNVNFINDVDNRMHTILVSEQIFRDVINNLINVYMKNYTVYASNYQANQIMFILIVLAIVTVLLVVFILTTYFTVFKSISKHSQICDIIQIQSYLVDKSSLVSFKEEEKQKRKLQIKKKTKKKKEDDVDAVSANTSQIAQSVKGNEQPENDKEENSKKPKARLSIFKRLTNGVK